MKSFIIISFYSIVVSTANFFLIDIEHLILNQLSTEESLLIPENAVLDTIENIKYWNKFSIIFTFLLFSVKGLIISFILYIGLFFEDFKEIRLGDLFKIAI